MWKRKGWLLKVVSRCWPHDKDDGCSDVLMADILTLLMTLTAPTFARSDQSSGPPTSDHITSYNRSGAADGRKGLHVLVRLKAFCYQINILHLSIVKKRWNESKQSKNVTYEMVVLFDLMFMKFEYSWQEANKTISIG